MNRLACVFVVAGMALGSAPGRDVVFHKSEISDRQGKGRKVDLAFLDQGKAIVVRERLSVLAKIPYDAIDQLAYGYSKRHRVKEGGEVLLTPLRGGHMGILLVPVAVVIAVPMMLTQEKKHWLYVDYREANLAKHLVLRLDKSEFEKVIATAKAQTGKDVEMIPEEGKGEEAEGKQKTR